MASGVPNPSVRIPPMTMRMSGRIAPFPFSLSPARDSSVSSPVGVAVSWFVASTTSKLIVGLDSFVSSPRTAGVGFFVGGFGDETVDVVDETAGVLVGITSGVGVRDGVGVLVGLGVLVGVGTSVGTKVGDGTLQMAFVCFWLPSFGLSFVL